jgi:hypothetical protein
MLGLALQLDVPLKVFKLPEQASRVLYPRQLTLVRPDQHVCWRGDVWDANALRTATGESVTIREQDLA